MILSTHKYGPLPSDFIAILLTIWFQVKPGICLKAAAEALCRHNPEYAELDRQAQDSGQHWLEGVLGCKACKVLRVLRAVGVEGFGVLMALQGFCCFTQGFQSCVFEGC